MTQGSVRARLKRKRGYSVVAEKDEGNGNARPICSHRYSTVANAKLPMLLLPEELTLVIGCRGSDKTGKLQALL